MDENLLAWLRLSRLPGLGPRTLKRLHYHLGSARAIERASRSRLESLGLGRPLIDRLLLQARRPAVLHDQSLIETWLAEGDQHLLGFDDPLYPPALRQIADPPPCLYVRGDPELLSQPQLALVGSRHASVGGLESAREFARALSKAGLVVTSGLALGIDGQAHRGALEGLGLTVAVMGCGCDRIYPVRHRELAEGILAAGGALVSELPLGTPPRAQHFPKRNRIISGLSLGVLVVEAAPESGSLITARMALEQGREVFAMPGSIHNPAARGCHQLIRQGAKLVETLEHILEEVGPQLDCGRMRAAVPSPQPQPKPQPKPKPKPQSSPQPDPEPASSGAVKGVQNPQSVRSAPTGEVGRLLDATGYEPTPVDRLVMRSGVGAERVMVSMLELELEGWVVSVPGGFQRT